jgi:hypothetical protein
LLIADVDADTNEMAAYLGDSIPLRIVRWQAGDYLACILDLRPVVIVAAAETSELADNSAALIRALISEYSPTIAGLAPGGKDRSQPALKLQQLGLGTRARLASLSALDLDESA